MNSSPPRSIGSVSARITVATARGGWGDLHVVFVVLNWCFPDACLHGVVYITGVGVVYGAHGDGSGVGCFFHASKYHAFTTGRFHRLTMAYFCRVSVVTIIHGPRRLLIRFLYNGVQRCRLARRLATYRSVGRQRVANFRGRPLRGRRRAEYRRVMRRRLQRARRYNLGHNYTKVSRHGVNGNGVQVYDVMGGLHRSANCQLVRF